MISDISGIHHVTAITADAQDNIDFYCGVLGLRLVKLTVNFDDPGSYHLYYADELGHPGTIVTFFAWPGAPRGRTGPPQVTTMAFAIPARAFDFWADRLAKHRAIEMPSDARFGEKVLSVNDPDGIELEIVASAREDGHGPSGGPIPSEYAIRGLHGATISEEGYEKTASLLTDVMGFQAIDSEGNRFRYRAAAGNSASMVELLCVPSARRGQVSAGQVHHIAFRTPDDAQQATWREELVRLGYNVSPVMDRVYFHSIYYREPGGVLFEIATDPPGFTLDQAPEELGTKLMLPPWLESYRPRLEKTLPKLHLPEWHRQGVLL